MFWKKEEFSRRAENVMVIFVGIFPKIRKKYTGHYLGIKKHKLLHKQQSQRTANEPA